jgi:hypothetical protein
MSSACDVGRADSRRHADFKDALRLKHSHQKIQQAPIARAHLRNSRELPSVQRDVRRGDGDFINIGCIARLSPLAQHRSNPFVRQLRSGLGIHCVTHRGAIAERQPE